MRREYTLNGDVLNLAARLAFAAPGDVLCDEVTARSVRERFRFEPLAPIAVKGRAEPVAIRRFVGMGARIAPRHSPLVDRTGERAILTERLRRLLEDGESGAVVIEGDAGIGKSALVAEAGRLAEQGGGRVLTAAADAVERATAYYAWRPVFADVLGIEGEGPDAAALSRLVRERAPELERLAPLLSSVLAMTIADNEMTAAMSGDVRADNTTLLLTGLLLGPDRARAARGRGRALAGQQLVEPAARGRALCPAAARARHRASRRDRVGEVPGARRAVRARAAEQPDRRGHYEARVPAARASPRSRSG